VTAGDVLAVLDALEAEAIGYRVDGGWGIDALVGRQTRAHEDLDLVVARPEVGSVEASLAPLGFAHDATADPGLPARYVLRAPDGRQVDLHVVVYDDAGDGWQELGGGAWGRYTAGGLRGEGTIGGRRVGCVGADLQLSHHAGYPPDAADRHDVSLLAALLGREVPPPFGPPSG
jgi:lincosamide nucleotidyltransferase A/C/D/E